MQTSSLPPVTAPDPVPAGTRPDSTLVFTGDPAQLLDCLRLIFVSGEGGVIDVKVGAKSCELVGRNRDSSVQPEDGFERCYSIVAVRQVVTEALFYGTTSPSEQRAFTIEGWAGPAIERPYGYAVITLIWVNRS